MWGNLLMAAAGFWGAVLSNSTAIMMDGLFSLVGFGSSPYARSNQRCVSTAATAPRSWASK